ncbi:MAG: mechanosensitive ion channel [Actinobacteria bacterium]|nr:mechanosensitive ion channel [Actinomycetota bacterium]
MGRTEYAALADFGDWPAGRLVATAIVVAAACLALIALRWVVPRLVNRIAGRPDGPRSRQRQTAASLLASSLRYVVVLTALAAVFVLLAGGGALGAVSGAAVVLVLVTFASQRLLGDIIAGFFVLFEDQYAVGDLIRVEPSGLSGVVEELGLRTTVLRGANGDRCVIPNGQVTAVRRAPSAGHVLNVWLVTRDPDALAALLGDLGPALAGAALLPGGRTLLGDGIWGMSAEVSTSPGQDDAVERRLRGALAARGADLVIGEPLVTGVGPETVSRGSAGGGE